jgi:hypothetical protein
MRVERAGFYENDGMVVKDLGRLMRFVDGKMVFLLKSLNGATGCFEIELVSYRYILNFLETIPLEYHEKDKYSAADVLQKYLHYFSLNGICFSKVCPFFIPTLYFSIGRQERYVQSFQGMVL